MSNIFVTSDPHFYHDNIIKYCNRPFSNVDEMNLTLIRNWNSKVTPEDDVYVIGGASIYRQMLPYVDEVLLTKVEADGGAEVFFVNLDNDKNFKLVYESEVIKDESYDIRFLTYTNRDKKEI